MPGGPIPRRSRACWTIQTSSTGSNALDAAWTERHARQSRDQLEAELRERWHQTREESNPQRKGALLEQTLRLLFQTVPGLDKAKLNRRNELEEIDVLVRNESPDPFWSRQGDYLLVECKNWSKPAPRAEVTLFHQKLKDRFGRARLGFLVAIGGFTEPAEAEQLARREGQHLVVLLDRDALNAVIEAPDHGEALKERVDAAVMVRS